MFFFSNYKFNILKIKIILILYNKTCQRPSRLNIFMDVGPKWTHFHYKCLQKTNWSGYSSTKNLTSNIMTPPSSGPYATCFFFYTCFTYVFMSERESHQIGTSHIQASLVVVNKSLFYFPIISHRANFFGFFEFDCVIVLNYGNFK